MARPTLTTTSSWADLSGVDRLAIQAFLDQADTASPFQDPLFSGGGALGGGLAEHWFVLRDKEHVLLAGYAIENFALGRHFPRQRCLVFPRGPVVSDASALGRGLRSIEDWARTRGFVHIEVQPQWMDDAIAEMSAVIHDLGWRQVEQANAPMTLRIHLAKGLDGLLAGFDKGTRYEVRRAQKVGIDVRFAASAIEYERYYECYLMTCQRKGFTGLERDNFLGLMSRIAREPSRGGLLLAEMDQDLLGGIVVLRAGPCLHYAYGASTDRSDLRKLPIGYLLQWRAIEWAREIGLTAYDLGGYTATPQNSTARFKKGFGGVPVRIAPLHRRILRPLLYGSAVGLKKLKSFRKPAGQ
jgi:lipid II:glycine glycyltransferase (peptidoglycan interpeptide bridge formation enzyme)